MNSAPVRPEFTAEIMILFFGMAYMSGHAGMTNKTQYVHQYPENEVTNITDVRRR